MSGRSVQSSQSSCLPALIPSPFCSPVPTSESKAEDHFGPSVTVSLSLSLTACRPCPRGAESEPAEESAAEVQGVGTASAGYIA